MSTLKLDTMYTHSKNLGNMVGDFCGSPIVEMYLEEMDVDRIVDVQRTIEINRNSPKGTVEILPGEMICDDNIIRRGSTAEANPEFYNYQISVDARKVTLAEARQLLDEGAMITWRPNRVVGQEEFAIVHE